MLELHKFLPLIVSPLGLVVGLWLLAFLVREARLAWLGLLVFVLSALPATANWLWKTLESDYPYQPVASVERADAIVVLSGMLGGFEQNGHTVPEWGEGVDRLFSGVELYHAGKAPLIIFTRGYWPWLNLPPEGEILANKAIALGVPDSRILLTDLVSNTEDEAREVNNLMAFAGLKRVILVTSSFHMPRARMLFALAGIETTPYAVDFRGQSALDWMSWIPSADGFARTSEGIRELIGRLYYRVKILVTSTHSLHSPQSTVAAVSCVLNAWISNECANRNRHCVTPGGIT